LAGRGGFRKRFAPAAATVGEFALTRVISPENAAPVAIGVDLPPHYFAMQHYCSHLQQRNREARVYIVFKF
jgi:hypothetical protein